MFILERPAKFRRNLASKLTMIGPPATQYQREFDLVDYMVLCLKN